MNKLRMISMSVFVGFLVSGCALQEVRSKSAFGPEFRHKGSNRTDAVRWTVQQGFEFKWDKGISTGITYRRRDTDDGNGDNDNRVLLEFSFPIWKAKKAPNVTAQRVEELERRLAELETELTEQRQERLVKRTSDTPNGGTH